MCLIAYATLLNSDTGRRRDDKGEREEKERRERGMREQGLGFGFGRERERGAAHHGSQASCEAVEEVKEELKCCAVKEGWPPRGGYLYRRQVIC